MLNKVMIIGRLGRDPELRYTQILGRISSVRVIIITQGHTECKRFYEIF